MLHERKVLGTAVEKIKNFMYKKNIKRRNSLDIAKTKKIDK